MAPRLLVLALLASCAAPSADERAVLATLDRLIAADAAGDADAVVAEYAEDVVMVGPDGTVLAGREAAHAHYAGMFEAFAMEVSAAVEGVAVAGDWADAWGTTRGRILWRDGREPLPFDDRFAAVLRRGGDGRWRIARLVWHPLP